MFHCPKCLWRLIRTKTPQGFVFVCSRCRGRAMTMAVLRRVIRRDALRRLWGRVTAPDAQNSSSACPCCTRPMAHVPLAENQDALDLDVCRRCQLVWLDSRELGRLPAKPPTPAPQEDLSQEAREQVALAKVRLIGERGQQSDFGDEPPDEFWKWIVGVLGMPVEQESNRLRSLPWMTWAITAVCVLTAILTLDHVDSVASDFGLIPDQASRYGGLTFLTSFFLHAGLLHLIGNMYFLLVFGDNVEDYLGKLRYAALLFSATVAGGLVHSWLEPRSDIPLIGASGGISGVIVYYALRFPRARIGLLLQFWYYIFRWIYVPAWFAIIVWVALQIIESFQQIAGLSSVSALGHLGGAAAGLLAWMVFRVRTAWFSRQVGST